MAFIRLALIPLAAAALLTHLSLKASEASFDAQYVGGTAKDIPPKTTGTLNLKDRQEMRFWYGTEVRSIPYAQIKTSELSSVPQTPKRLFGHVPVPSSVLRRKTLDTLRIDYAEGAGAVNTVSFQLSAKEAAIAKELLADRIDGAASAGTNIARDEWWGDKYWKTGRNRAQWEAQVSSANK